MVSGRKSSKLQSSQTWRARPKVHDAEHPSPVLHQPSTEYQLSLSLIFPLDFSRPLSLPRLSAAPLCLSLGSLSRRLGLRLASESLPASSPLFLPPSLETTRLALCAAGSPGRSAVCSCS